MLIIKVKVPQMTEVVTLGDDDIIYAILNPTSPTPLDVKIKKKNFFAPLQNQINALNNTMNLKVQGGTLSFGNLNGAAKNMSVVFSKTYTAIPTVLVSLFKLDSSVGSNTRINVVAQNITTTGFICRAETWSNSAVFDVGATWIAFGI